jgi:hypothetical protein
MLPVLKFPFILPVLKFHFFSTFYCRFCTPAENTIFLIMLNVFHRDLHDKIILYTETEMGRTIRFLATRKWRSDFCILNIFSQLDHHQSFLLMHYKHTCNHYNRK